MDVPPPAKGSHDPQAARGVELEIPDIERDELRAPQRGGEPEQQQRPVAPAGDRRGVDRLEQPRQRVELERRGLAQRASRVERRSKARSREIGGRRGPL
jgi:hypothetical protein